MSENDEAAEDYKELVRYIVEGLIDTDDFTIDTEERRGQIRIALECPENLRGRVIGRGGRIARALRAVLDAANVDSPRRPSFDIVD